MMLLIVLIVGLVWPEQVQQSMHAHCTIAKNLFVPWSAWNTLQLGIQAATRAAFVGCTCASSDLRACKCTAAIACASWLHVRIVGAAYMCVH
jgi:hypothetical protein